MKAIQKAQFRSRMALRLLAASALAASLAGCYQTDTAQVEYPFDYRQRHPITVRLAAIAAASRRANGRTSSHSRRPGVVSRAAALSSRYRAAAQRIVQPQTRHAKSVLFLPP